MQHFLVKNVLAHTVLSVRNFFQSELGYICSKKAASLVDFVKFRVNEE